MAQIFSIPADPQSAIARLDELGPLACSIGWERGLLVYALTQPGRPGPKPKNSGTFTRISFREFAKKGIHGLRTHNSLSSHWYAVKRAIEAGVVAEVKLGDTKIEEPPAPWSDFYPPEKTDIDEAVGEAIEADARAVADQAYSKLKEDRKLEEERNQDLRDSFRTERLKGVMEEYGLTREEAEARIEEEDRPYQEKADRRAHRSEIHKTLGLATKVMELVAVFVPAVNADYELLRDEDRAELLEASELLQRAYLDIFVALNQQNLDGIPGEAGTGE